MEIRNLESFIQAAELGSFTRAVKKLGYTQSSISCGSASWRTARHAAL
ncbi:MAG: LysR family transcriptional regulator [Eisenbergiella sp.]